MILAVHLVLGGAIALAVKPVSLGLVLAFLSHFILDALPHWQYSVKNIKSKNWKNSFPDFVKVFLDAGFGVAVLCLFSKEIKLALSGAFLGILPDGFTFLSLVLPNNPLLSAFRKFHEKINSFQERKSSSWIKIISELLVFVLTACFLAASSG
jgi:hypothetical protein